MTGLAYFSGLNYLYCDNNRLTKLDLTHNPALESLYCDNNRLTKLDVSKNTALEYLDCSYNLMTMPSDVKGWQKIGLVKMKTFIFYPQNIGAEILFSGEVLYQTSPRAAYIELFDSTGELIYIATTDEYGAYMLFAPAGTGYTLTVSKLGYLSYTIKNLTLTGGEAIESIDIRQMAGDVNGDGVVNAIDITQFLSEFNKTELKFPAADIDGNGIANAIDLTYLLAGFNKKNVSIDKNE
jgi:hypothetical protein